MTLPIPTRDQWISWLRFVAYGCTFFAVAFAAAEPPIWITCCVAFGGGLATFRLAQLTDEATKEAKAQTSPEQESRMRLMQEYIDAIEQRHGITTPIAISASAPPSVPEPPL